MRAMKLENSEMNRETHFQTILPDLLTSDIITEYRGSEQLQSIGVQSSILSEEKNRNHESGIEQKKDKSFMPFNSPSRADKEEKQKADKQHKRGNIINSGSSHR